LVQVSGVSPVLSPGPLSGHCDACALTQRIADRKGGHTDSDDPEAVDEDVVVLSPSGSVGLVVVPRHHVSGLEELPIPTRARVFAALRRVSVAIGEEYEGSAPSVVVTTDPPASTGHVCFQVVPSNRRLTT
jgi:hypothetical protein